MVVRSNGQCVGKIMVFEVLVSGLFKYWELYMRVVSLSLPAELSVALPFLLVLSVAWAIGRGFGLQSIVLVACNIFVIIFCVSSMDPSGFA